MQTIFALAGFAKLGALAKTVSRFLKASERRLLLLRSGSSWRAEGFHVLGRVELSRIHRYGDASRWVTPRPTHRMFRPFNRPETPKEIR
jgi:hypothetical protein